MNRSITRALGTLLALSPARTAVCSTLPVPCAVPRTPHGIYATGTVPKVGGHTGSSPLNYLQVWGVDITYASDSEYNPKVPLKMGSTMTYVSAQNLLHMANLALAMTAE